MNGSMLGNGVAMAIGLFVGWFLAMHYFTDELSTTDQKFRMLKNKYERLRHRTGAPEDWEERLW